MNSFLVRAVIVVALLSVSVSATRLFYPNTDELFQALMGNGPYDYPVADQPADSVKGGSQPSADTEQQQESVPAIKEPSNCVWAILRCCVPGSIRVNIGCFEGKGCDANFFDQSPCRRESASNAYRIVSKYQAMKDAMKREEAQEPVQESQPGPGPLPFLDELRARY